MKIIQWHIEGGYLYMVPLSVLFMVNLILIGKALYTLYIQGRQDPEVHKRLLAIKFIGSFALSFGIFAQTLGLTFAFDAIADAGAISQSVLAGGLKVSMYTTVYGLIIFLVSYLGWYLLKRKALY